MKQPASSFLKNSDGAKLQRVPDVASWTFIKWLDAMDNAIKITAGGVEVVKKCSRCERVRSSKKRAFRCVCGFMRSGKHVHRKKEFQLYN
jgi:hypothetical protein